MKLTCEKAIIENAINTANRTASTQTSVPILTGLLLQAQRELTITGYNLKTGIRTTIPAEIQETGEIVISAKLLGDIIRRMPDNLITITSDTNLSVHLSCGNANFNIQGQPASDYPELPPIETETNAITLQQKTLQKMIQETSFAISVKENRPIYTGALFEIQNQILTIVTVDGFRLAIREEPIDTSTDNRFSFVAPGSALSDVEKICNSNENPVTISLGNRSILFQIDNTELICRKLEGEFLDYHNTIPKSNPIRLTADKKSLINSIERVSVVISDKLKMPLHCQFQQDQVTLSALTAEGNAEDICPLSGDGQNLEIGFNNRYLLEALRYAPANEVCIQLNTSISPALITPADEKSNFLYMVLPVRLKSNE